MAKQIRGTSRYYKTAPEDLLQGRFMSKTIIYRNLFFLDFLSADINIIPAIKSRMGNPLIKKFTF